MLKKTFEFNTDIIKPELLIPILKIIEKDLKLQGVLECSLDSSSIYFKGKGTINSVDSFNSIDYCEIKIDVENSILTYEIFYDNLLLTAVPFSLLTIFSILIFGFSLMQLISLPVFLLFFFSVSSNIINTHHSYGESLVCLIEEDVLS